MIAAWATLAALLLAAPVPVPVEPDGLDLKPDSQVLVLEPDASPEPSELLTGAADWHPAVSVHSILPDKQLWVRVRLESPRRQTVVVEFPDAFGASSAAWAWPAGTPAPRSLERRSGREPSYDVELAGQPVDVLVRLDSAVGRPLLPRLYASGPYARALERRASLRGGILAVMAAFAVYMLLLYIITREHDFGLYAGYVAALLPALMWVHGGLVDPVTGINSPLVDVLALASGGGSAGLLLAFVRRYVETEQRHPRWDRFVRRFVPAYLLTASPAMGLGAVSEPALVVGNLLAMTIFVVLGVTLYFAVRDAPQRNAFLGVSILVLILGTLAGLLTTLRVLPLTELAHYSVALGALAQVVLMAAALAQRRNLLRREREAALRAHVAIAQQNQALTDVFERYVPKAFLAELKRASILEIGRGDAEQRDMTIFFSDIRGFTALSEGLSPPELFQVVNRYLAAVTPPIEAEGGFIDKYIGDAVMALFAAGEGEDGSDRAVCAALATFEALDELNRGSDAELDIGIGLHRGPVMLGVVGSDRRLNATVLGDSVNLAARVEELTRVYDARVLITDDVRSTLHGEYAMRPIDRVRVKGKEAVVTVYEVFEGAPDQAAKERTRPIFERGLAAYQHLDIAEAKDAFEAVLAETDDPVARLYVERCARLLETGWESAFDGVERVEAL